MNNLIKRSCLNELLFKSVLKNSPNTFFDNDFVYSNHSGISYRNLMNQKDSNNSTSVNNDNFIPPKEFKPQKVLVLGKFSRYEFEKHRNPDLTEDQLMKHIESNGSDYKMLTHHHEIHQNNREHILKCLEKQNIEARSVNRFGLTDELIQWADMVVTSGGDGTYLMAASRINSRFKPLIGINSDPTRSVGHLCLPKRYSNRFDKALELILNGKFEWDFRQRIRITLEGERAFELPVELHDQQLMQHECRFLDWENIHKTPKTKPTANDKQKKNRLPHLALNEVFVGEALSSRVSYFEIAVDDLSKIKIKSSGATICTGTGSTSWFFNINKLTHQCVSNLFKIINEENFNGEEVLNHADQELIQRVTDRFNTSLIFPPGELRMAYVIRDPVVFGTNFNRNPRDFAKKIMVRSRMTDGHIVIDGGLSYAFNDGLKAFFEMFPEDVLRTIKLKP